MGFFSSLAAAVFDPSRENLNRWKGAKGEAQAAVGLLLLLPEEYKVINDILMTTPRGTTQIDHVVVSNYGIFVIESKNISGVIYGRPEDEVWTVYRRKSQFTFLNPLRQNAAHIQALAAATGLPDEVFHSLIFFWSDDCRFGNPKPENVRQAGLCSYIKGKRRYLLTPKDVEAAVRLIEAKRIPSTTANMNAHVASLKRRFA